jgi:hypothetical protein
MKEHQVNEIGLRVVDLQNIGYQDDPWVLASRVAQVFYMPNPLSNLPPKKTKHVVAYRKQHIIGVDGMDDVGSYNDYAEMPLFTDFSNKISAVERNLPKDILPWERKRGKGKLFQRGQASLCKCVCETIFMYVCETMFMYVSFF